MKKLLFLAILLIAGCKPELMKETPAKFTRGDQIYFKNEPIKLGIITSTNWDRYKGWDYSIMFQQNNIYNVPQDELILFKTINWNDMIVPDSQAEFEANKYQTIN